MNTNIFSFSSSSLDHIAFAMAKGMWAVTKSSDLSTSKRRATKSFNHMKVGDFVILVGTKESGYQGVVAVGQIESLPELETHVGEDGTSYLLGKTASDVLWGEGPWYMPFKVKFLHTIKPENTVTSEKLKDLGLSLTSLNAKGTQNFVPADVSGDQFLDIWQMLSA